MAEPESEQTPEKSGTDPVEKKNHKWIVIGAIAGVAVLILFYVQSKNAAAASSSGNAAVNPYAMSGTMPSAVAGGSGGGRGLMSLSRRVGALQYQLDAIAAGQGASRVGSSSLSSPVPSGSTAGHTGASQINPYTYGNPTNGAGNFPTSSIPQNQYHVGQVVNPGTGEYITGSTYDPVYGWLNETNLGGVYTSGGSRSISTTPYGGSYLGYLSSLKTSNPAQYAVESKSPFHFAGAPRVNNTTGAYALTSTAGGTYNF